MDKQLALLGLFLGGSAVVLGAFGAHALEAQLTADALATFDVGIRYQMVHALLSLFLALACAWDAQQILFTGRVRRVLFSLLLAGVLLFSGSIYGLSTNELTAFDFTTIALLTPLGGTLLIGVWVYLFLLVFKKL
ncbi:DUF423 domain-containing protein [Croceiramulus getboli]|nr:DUF423 domain-containing protein [Flavobacteriaceae bacterium YJPT1-3]